MKIEILIEGLDSNHSKIEILNLLLKQLNNFFVCEQDEIEHLGIIQQSVLHKLKVCISGVQNKYYSKNNKPYFSPFHSGQYLTYLYLFSKTCYLNGFIELSEKLYYLNKIMHACDIYPAVELPDVFFLEHPVGTVLGRAKYGENFFAMQGCTIGGNKEVYPVIGNNVEMYSNSKIIGNSIIGNNVQIGANAYVKDSDIPDNSIVFGQYPNNIIKEKHTR